MYKNKIKQKVIIGGMLVTTIISIILAFVLDCEVFGLYIVIFDVSVILLWLPVGNYLVNEKFKNK